MLSLEELKTQIMKGKSIEEILKKSDWKNFESVIARIFEENNFLTKLNFRFKTKRRYEIDIIAIRNNKIFCVDCKLWDKGRYKKTSLKYSITTQEKRVKEFRKFLKKNPIARSMLKIESDFTVYPLLITLYEENMIKEKETFVIPAWKLNSFVNELESYI